MLNDTRSASPNPQEIGTAAASIKKSASFVCEMCQNYETKLVQCQEEAKMSSQYNGELSKELEEMKEDLEKEIALRLDLDKQCQEKRERHKDEVESLTAQVKKTEDLFHQLIKTYNEMKESTNQELVKLTAERERIYHHLENLQKDNDFLSGKYLTHSQELKDEEIDLPQNIDELNELGEFSFEVTSKICYWTIFVRKCYVRKIISFEIIKYFKILFSFEIFQYFKINDFFEYIIFENRF